MNGTTSSYGNPSEVQGVCPDGWHLPSDEEWKELEMYLGISPDTVDAIGLRGIIIGSKLASSPEGWVDGYLNSNERAWGRHIYSSNSSVHRYMNVKSDGFSVRCVKDE